MFKCIPSVIGLEHPSFHLRGQRSNPLRQCSDQGLCHFPWGGIDKMVKKLWQKYFSLWLYPLQWVKLFKFVHIKVHAIIQGNVIAKSEIILTKFKHLVLKNHQVNVELLNLAQRIFGWKGFKFVQMKDRIFYQGEILTK